jgi:hypothetical protein
MKFSVSILYTFIRLKLLLKLETIKHGFKYLAACGGIRGVDDTFSFSEEKIIDL